MRRAVYPSGNSKTGRMAVTYLPVRGTCDKVGDCPLYDSGCYAQTGHVAIHVSRLERSGIEGDVAAYAAAAEVVRLATRRRPPPVGTPLRWGVSGDVVSEAGAAAVARTADTWAETVRGPTYGYTHSWRRIPRAAFGRAAINASVESIDDALVATALGYRPAIVVSRHPDDGRARVVRGLRIIPCPSQTRDVSCTDCGLCWRETPGTAIAFSVHGASHKRALTVVR